MTNWVDLPRLETTSNRILNTTIAENIEVINLGYGINLYRNAIKKNECDNIINKLENEISLNVPPVAI